MNLSNRELEAPPVLNDPSAAHGGSALHEKPVKAVIGLGVMIALSLLLYEINHSRPDDGPPRTMAQRLHMPSQSH